MSDANPSVLIIDDDPEFRDLVARLLRSVGLHTQQFSSVSDFFNADPPDGPTCLVLDIRMPGRSGLELQRDLAAANRQVPIIFITAHADIPMTVQAMKGGAIEFLTKPFRDQDLLDAVEAGLARDRARRESDRALGALRERFDTLSSREREIMIQVTAGRLNKQIANDIGIAESTVKVHRTHLMRKMKARSLPELSRMADMLKLAPEKPPTLLTGLSIRIVSKPSLSVANQKQIAQDPGAIDCAPQFDDVCATRRRSTKVWPTGGANVRNPVGFCARGFSGNGN